MASGEEAAALNLCEVFFPDNDLSSITTDLDHG